MTKTLDQLMFAFYAKNDGLRITDLHQGIVWGTQTEQTIRDERLINRFDYDGDYGTVLNRFLMQAAIGNPLTVHGTGGQTRAFIHIRDAVHADSVLSEMTFRAAVVRQIDPTWPIDTDGWPMPSLTALREYISAQPSLGVPSLYYATHLDTTGEALTNDDYGKIIKAWSAP